ncbi:putative disease resistance RPP13-like protein 3 [Brachypodium distachyon]|uniref:NB-ARC domain-containing protein n=1 Tax=Brachypodium distachyon TaxID=15368 RepID=I1I6L9_BRADI|nr:putative disease resistance RPP13-like protein 3 [Brachypodium distachyon]XP_014756769.1 putative disease resistance RPP13-like protein 3 [Brachypodium distachyon]XP_014756770.1 putative disease resistance RPP13-like protein 3 [Brachypodium distachyon]XP_014756771.1 putative disease resistance RPP13-like protein 3 [Brachypodium distachyon]XP_014756772.1 putative disease resistance RPP13-like protein 3 [Brachypodium distachyon]XP_024316973.1 putative disease resistance RPP13-like protein 3 [|eukprot:XP_014756768.1 putative disease resistance RPP13-like protein 3 [Brachypodium distachyon]
MEPRAAGVSAATGAMEPVLGKLAALLADEHGVFKGFRGDAESLRAELQAMHASLRNVSEAEEPDERAKRWMNAVREFSYDVEDGLDEFVLSADDGSANKADEFVEKMRNWSRETIDHRRMGEEISDTISKASNVAEDPRASFLCREMPELVGIDGPAGELTKMLNGGGENASAQQLKVVSIVGPGGLGKTALACHVYGTFGQQFKYRAFVSVSRKPDVVTILRAILSQVGYDQTIPGDAQLLVDKVTNFIQDKRYFIIVDDVWDVQTWDIIKRAFSKSSCGSRIITTTRIHEVAKSCCASYGGRVYELSPLSIVDSERLFLKIVFNSEEQCPSHLKRVSDKILQKCGGLPLAIIAISGLLTADAHEDQWEQVCSSIRHGPGSNPVVERIMRILFLSYIDLTPCLKSCLLYLSIFPEGYAIAKERLIMRWIAEGFILEEHGHTLYESGERCFNELINRNLIQPGDISKFGKVETCRAHAMILDFIISMSKEQNFVTLLGVPGVNPESQNKVRRLSLQDTDSSEIPTDLVICNARSLTIFGHCVKVPSVLEFRHLRILDFEGSMELEDHHLADVDNLFYLKYLRLKNSKITKLPQHIAELQYLESIDISGNKTTIELPSTINRLRQLAHLVVNDEAILPDEIGGIQTLQVLEGINVNSQSTNFVRQLGQLTNLRKLSISFINYYAGDNWKENQEEMVSSICRLGQANLHVLHITINEGADEIFEESWCPAPLSLRELVIEGIVSTVPRWVGSLVNLEKLLILMWEVGQDDVVILGGLPDLRYLCLTALAAGSKEGRLRVTQRHGFPSLSSLQIGGEECGLGLIFEDGSMTKLQNLELEFDAEETNSLTNGDFDFGIEHLSCLTSTRIRCAYDESICPTLEDAMETAINAHPNHPTLVWTK